MSLASKRQRNDKRLYLIEDTKQDMLPVYCGTIEEVAMYFNASVNSVFNGMSLNHLRHARYLISKAGVWETEEGDMYEDDYEVQ